MTKNSRGGGPTTRRKGVTPTRAVTTASRPWGLIAASVAVAAFAVATIGYAVVQVNRAEAGKVTALEQIPGVQTFELPADAGPDSFNVLPVLLDKPHEPIRDCLVLQNFNGRNVALRQGQWKFIPAEGQARGPQLYDLKNDLRETKNLARSKPEIVAQMRERLSAVRKAERTRP